MKLFTNLTIICLIILTPMKNFGQKVKKITRYELLWAICHPLIASTAFEITQKAGQIANEQINNPQLDGDYNGGQVDAFRHTLWMAMLVQEIKPKAAKKLGIAHEKANYLYFKRHKNEDGSIPDSISSQMDLQNNEIGLEIGQIYMGVDTNTLIQIVIRAVLDGKCFIIKKNELGELLDSENNIISQNDIKSKWLNNKVLVPSNYKKPKY